MDQDKGKSSEISLAAPCDGESREYQAFRGKTTALQEMILLVPNKGEHDRYLPMADIRLMAPAKSGGEIIIEASNATIWISGRNLRSGAHMIANRLCGSIEAFDPARRDVPADPSALFVESIRFFDPPKRQPQEDEDNPSPRRARPQIVKQSG